MLAQMNGNKNQSGDIISGFETYLQSKAENIHKYMRNLRMYIQYMIVLGDSINTHTIGNAFIQHIESYYPYLIQQKTEKKISDFQLKENERTINLLLEYLENIGYSIDLQKHELFKEKILSTYIKATKRLPSRTDLLIENCHHFREYLGFCSDKNLACLREKKYKVARFINFLLELRGADSADQTLSTLTPQLVKMYEAELLKFINLRKIKPASGYNHLVHVKHFLSYLKRAGIVNFNYSIPPQFSSRINRCNDYVRKEDIEKLLITAASATSSYALRNLTIVMLIVETGCRPIEIANLDIGDLDPIESTITLTSKKSGVRKLKLHHPVMEVVKKYLNLRKWFGMKDQALFLLNNGNRMNSESITYLFASLNKTAFGQVLFTAKSLRHTFATNALSSNNDFDQVSKTLGHNHWISTMHYFHRSITRLLKSSLPYDPTLLD